VAVWGRPGALIVSCCARNPGEAWISAHPVAEAAGAGSVSGDVRGSVDESTRNRSERTLPKSLTTRARAAALRLMGNQPREVRLEGEPTGGPETSGAGSAWTEPVSDLILLGLVLYQPGFVGPAVRTFRVAEAALGRATLVGLTLCLRLPADAGSLSEYFLTDVPRDGCGLPGHPPKEERPARFAEAKPSKRVRRGSRRANRRGGSHTRLT
jgi:hypothetical protein